MTTRFQLSLVSVGLVVLRVGAGAMMVFGHGLEKVTMLMAGDDFYDPFDLGGKSSMYLVTVGELICPLLVMLGFCTRVCAVATATTMSIAAFLFHGAHPIFGPMPSKELAIIYMIPFAALVFTGPGRLSVDGLIFRAKSATPVES